MLSCGQDMAAVLRIFLELWSPAQDLQRSDLSTFHHSWGKDLQGSTPPQEPLAVNGGWGRGKHIPQWCRPCLSNILPPMHYHAGNVSYTQWSNVLMKVMEVGACWEEEGFGWSGGDERG